MGKIAILVAAAIVLGAVIGLTAGTALKPPEPESLNWRDLVTPRMPPDAQD